jgi:hypothetical protein|tara:strand:+ start:203 stop:418 length:216 start_codon:yes stop_codon:yes gene_type:complete
MKKQQKIEYSNNKIQYQLDKLEFHVNKIGIKNVNDDFRLRLIDILKIESDSKINDDDSELKSLSKDEIEEV